MFRLLVCSNVHKILVVIVFTCIVLQYTFTAIFDGKHFEPLFSISLGSDHIPNNHRGHSPHRGIIVDMVNNEFTTHFPQNEDANVTLQISLPEERIVNISSRPNGTEGSTIQTTLVPKLEECPSIPPGLVGPISVKTDSPSSEELELVSKNLELGGRYHPHQCQARDKVAIVIPYRDRKTHLNILLNNLHPFLQKQQLDYGIFVIEQYGKGPFNRAMLMNVGFVESLKLYDFECFIFHDVDLLPEDDRNLYSCPEQPRHMSVAINIFRYKLPYQDIFGGVSAMTRSQFEAVNGFSNMFWGWGGEDDDMANRVKFNGFHISRYPKNVARYKMMTHKKEAANPKRYEFLNTGKRRFKKDGLNSLKYECKQLDLNKLYTRILVELIKPS